MIGAFDTKLKFMPLQVFEGGNGDLVILQEHSRPAGEQYLRVITEMGNAEALCEQIMAVARGARARG